MIKTISDLDQDPKSFGKKNLLTPLTKSLMKNLEENIYDEFVFVVNNLIKEKREKNTCSGEISISSMRFKEFWHSLEHLLRKMVRVFFPLKRILFSAARIHFQGFNRSLVIRKIKVAQSIVSKNVSLDYLSSRLFIISSREEDES